uniref:Protein MCM10 homolog n=1 Tax=Schistosoma mansoni TaxID=6183 RepID=A0A3Q0KPC0_SCHMA
MISKSKNFKRKSNHIQLTEKEINDFIAHSDDEETDGSESDWDDMGETDLSTILSSSTTNTKDNTVSKLSNEIATSSNHKITCNITKDIGVNELFGSVPSNVLLNEKEINPNMHELFGEANLSDDSSDDYDINQFHGIEDDENDRELTENGASIQKSLSVIQHLEKDKLIERHVNNIIQLNEEVTKRNSASSSTFNESNNKNNNSVSIALAACASRRQKAISALNKSSFTPNLVVSAKSTAITPVSNSNNQSTSVDKDCWLAIPTKLRVYRPRISSELWSSRTSDREVLTLPQYIQRHRNHQFVNNAKKSFTSEAVVVGVIGSKLPPRRSRNDRIYSVWCLSDLENIGPGSSSGCLKLFLFGNCHEKLWKEPEGSVVAILNPRSLSSGESFTDDKDVSITLESPLHVMILGESPDYGICNATTKSGQSCFHVINKSICRFCDFHVKKAYIEASTSRPGFVSASLPGFGGQQRKSRYTGDRPPDTPEPGVFTLPINTNFLVDNCYKPVVSSAKVKLSLTKLKAAGYQVDTSIGLGKNPEMTKTSQESSSFQSSSSVDNIKNSNLSDKDIPLITGKDSPIIINQSNKKVTEENSEKIPNHNNQVTTELNEAENKLVSVLRRPSAGSLNLLRHLEQESESDPVSAISKTATKRLVNKSNSEKSLNISQEFSSRLNSPSHVTFAEFFSNINGKHKHSVSTLPANIKPSLSNKSEQLIDLGPLPLTTSPQTTLSRSVSSSSSLITDAARLRATALVNAQGGVKKMTEKETLKRKANFSNVSSCSKVSVLSEILDNNPSKRAKLTSSSSSSLDLKTNQHSNDETTRKLLKENRAKKLTELAKQINQGSAHKNLVDVLENQTEQIRLNNLEKRDEFEQKLVNQDKEACTYVICETCNYRALKTAPNCRTSNHQIKYVKGFKHYFRCRQCSKRTVSLDRYPSKPCEHCGESLFEKTGVMKERKGVLLPHEQLLPRGIEEKFLS